MDEFAKDFGWGLGHVQKRVPDAFESDGGLLVLSDPFLQSAYGIEVDLAVHSVPRLRQDLRRNRDLFVYMTNCRRWCVGSRC